MVASASHPRLNVGSRQRHSSRKLPQPSFNFLPLISCCSSGCSRRPHPVRHTPFPLAPVNHRPPSASSQVLLHNLLLLALNVLLLKKWIISSGHDPNSSATEARRTSACCECRCSAGRSTSLKNFEKGFATRHAQLGALHGATVEAPPRD